jgi:hypothetical protein
MLAIAAMLGLAAWRAGHKKVRPAPRRRSKLPITQRKTADAH